jgi:flagellar biosynthesis chaperone FliJ
VSEQRESLLAVMQSCLASDNAISVSDMSNNRHYLEEIEQVLEQAASDLEKHKQAVDCQRDEVLNHQLGINKLERYRDRKDQSLFVEQEKDQMIRTDELWIQKSVAEKSHE